MSDDLIYLFLDTIVMNSYFSHAMKTDAKNLQRAIELSRPKVAARLVEFRERAGLSVQAVVDATGLSRSGIDKIEDGRASPSVRTVELYVTACRSTLAEFFEPWAGNGNGNGDGRKRREPTAVRRQA